ncbi:MAG: hypothetical protein Q7R54_00850 [bacterium]|nr:hypothetical protein [bacterium]
MEGSERAPKIRTYPERSTHEDYDIFTDAPDGGNIDLYYFHHYVEKLPSQITSLESLESELRTGSWDDETSDASPARMIDEFRSLSGDMHQLAEKNPEWKSRLERIQAADYSYPVLMYKGRIVDGLHRAVHAILDKHTEIPVHNVNELPSEAFVSDDFLNEVRARSTK